MTEVKPPQPPVEAQAPKPEQAPAQPAQTEAAIVEANKPTGLEAAVQVQQAGKKLEENAQVDGPTKTLEQHANNNDAGGNESLGIPGLDKLNPNMRNFLLLYMMTGSGLLAGGLVLYNMYQERKDTKTRTTQKAAQGLADISEAEKFGNTVTVNPLAENTTTNSEASRTPNATPLPQAA